MHLLVEHGIHMMQSYIIEGMSRSNTGEYMPDDGKPGWLLACFMGPGLTVQGNTDKYLLERPKTALFQAQHKTCHV